MQAKEDAAEPEDEMVDLDGDGKPDPIDLDGDGKWDELFIIDNFAAKEKKTVPLQWVKDAPKFPVRTSVRFGNREAENIPLSPETSETVNAHQVYNTLGFQKYQTAPDNEKTEQEC